MHKLVLFFALLVSVVFVSASFNIRQHLGTKTPYTPLQTSGYTPPPATCTPKHFNYLARHGSRQASSSKSFIRLQNYFATSNYGSKITNPAYQWLNGWISPFPDNLSGQLTYYGELEHYQAAKRYKNLFPDVLGEPYSPLTYNIQTTQVPRTGISANSFAYGLFEGKGNLTLTKYAPVYTYTLNSVGDLDLYYFHNCLRYQELQNTPIPSEQNDLFLRQLETINPVIAQILGPQMALNTTIVSDMWDACRLEIASFNTSQFCSLFSEQTNSVLEYNEDLKYYYKEGYGYEINYNISVVLLQDFFQTITSAISGGFQQKARLRFAHAETVMPFVAMLGLYKDEEPITYDSQNRDTRKWRTSEVANFGTNIAFALYECAGAQETPEPSYVVKLLHNEKEFLFPGCNQMYCPLEKLTEIYSEKLSLNFTDMCEKL